MVKTGLARLGYVIERRDEATERYLKTWEDPLSANADDSVLRTDNLELAALRERYAALDWPVVRHSRWADASTRQGIRLGNFRGESLYIWHYREAPRITRLKFFLFLQYARARDAMGLLGRLQEDGAFGCWTFDFGTHGRVSRDLLDSVLEINFLERQLDISRHRDLRVLDIGAGYGRLAYRMTEALPNIIDYACIDAIPESTYLSRYYLQHRGAGPRARVLDLDTAPAALQTGHFDLALNVHSFSECTLEAIGWWCEQLARMQIPWLMIVPNDGEALLSTEADGSRRDFLPLIEAAGYRRSVDEPVFDSVVRELMAVHDDHYQLYQWHGAAT